MYGGIHQLIVVYGEDVSSTGDKGLLRSKEIADLLGDMGEFCGTGSLQVRRHILSQVC